MTTSDHDHSHSHSHGHSHDHDGHNDPCRSDTSANGVEDPGHLDSTPPAHPDAAARHLVLRKLKMASLLCTLFFLVEVVGGFLAGSLAVLSDAAHLAADLSAFIVAISGSHIANLPASETHTFGLKRTESLAALFSMTCLVILSLGLAVEAVRRLWVILYGDGENEMVDGQLMATIAFIGVVVNVVLAFVLGEDHVHHVGADQGHDHSHEHGSHGNDHSHGHSHAHSNVDELKSNNNFEGHNHDHVHYDEEKAHNSRSEHDHDHDHNEETATLIPLSPPSKSSYSATAEACHFNEIIPDNPPTSHTPARNVNLHAAYLHVLADLTQSVVVFIAGLIIWWKPTWQITDPICTLIFSVLVCWSTFGVIRSSLSVLLEEVPPGVSWTKINDAIISVDGISNVHDLHIWSIAHGNTSLSVHATATDLEKAYSDIKKLCHREKISHITVQLQPPSIVDCVTCTEDSVHQCR
mmetsp:Transcript_29191/g.58496  ORF Transcript_29191/g.58496 Transcript_29191/m.58496 type:complete len:466 (+) Transcript_29191:133-1530(+)